MLNTTKIFTNNIHIFTNIHINIIYWMRFFIGFTHFLKQLFLFFSKNPVLEAEAQGNNVACQVCRKLVDAFFANFFAGGVLGKKKGTCIWHKEEFVLGNANDHVHRCKQLGVCCTDCKQPVRRTDHTAHQQVCAMGDVQCSCGTKIKQAQLTAHHKYYCNLRETPCPFQCGATLKRCVLNISFFLRWPTFAVKKLSFSPWKN